MAEEVEAAGAAGRLEHALDRIEKAMGARARGEHRDQAKTDLVAHRLDVLIDELRAALEQSRKGDLA
jgi:hypothetical protein